MRLISSTRANNWVTVHVEVEEAVIRINTKEKEVKQSAGMCVSNHVKGEEEW